jgi:peroxiredoxin
LKSIHRYAAATFAVLLNVFATAQAAGNEGFLTFDGREASVESHAGKGNWLVVMMWAQDCHVCNAEVEGYAQLHEAYAGEGASVLGISIDGEADKDKARDFIRRHDVPFPNLIAEPQVAMRWYATQTGSRFLGTPTILIYGPDGELQAAQAGAVSPEVIEKFIAENS